MATYAAIADVGDTVVSLLRDRMTGIIDADEIALVSPGDVAEKDKLRLTLYLYEVTENEHLSNDARPSPDSGSRVGAPLVLDLHYLLTAHPASGGGDQRTTETMEEHTVLGRAMQVLHDNAIVGGSDLKGSLAGGDRLYISPDGASTKRVIDVWSTFQETPYRPSISYVVTPVELESTIEREAERVVETDRDYYRFEHRTGGGG